MVVLVLQSINTGTIISITKYWQSGQMIELVLQSSTILQNTRINGCNVTCLKKHNGNLRNLS